MVLMFSVAQPHFDCSEFNGGSYVFVFKWLYDFFGFFFSGCSPAGLSLYDGSLVRFT